MRRSSCLLFASLVTLSLATEGGIRGSKSEQSETEKKFMDVEYINSGDLENLLVQVEADEKRLQSLEDVLLPGFQALPKSSERLTHHGVRYLLHRHFLESHGWLVKGLEPEGTVIGHWHVLVFFLRVMLVCAWFLRNLKSPLGHLLRLFVFVFFVTNSPIGDVFAQ